MDIQNIPIPPLDVPTRWNSTFKMLMSIKNQEEFFKNFQDGDFISAELWPFLENFKKAFSPVYECTIKLQSQNITVGDFVSQWITLKMKLTAVSNDLANDMLSCMEARQKKLIDNDVVKAALYMDQRFNFAGPCSPYLTMDGKKDAEVHLFYLTYIFRFAKIISK